MSGVFHSGGVGVARPVRDLGAPERVIACWPADIGLLALVSGGDPAGRWSRWCVLAPSGGEVIGPEGLGVVRGAPGAPGAMDREPNAPPFVGGWIGWIGYDAGICFEPTARDARKRAAPASGRGWLMRCDAAYVHDRLTGGWYACGVDDAALRSLPRPTDLLERDLGFRAGRLTSVEGRARYERSVARVVEYVHAGDVFQANIAHRMRCVFEGSARGAFLRMHAAASPWFGALLEGPANADVRSVVASISPELFLSADFATREILTRPIKGTRDAGARAQAKSLSESGKDAAELAMIVDLMRNDLSRVCEFGTVEVLREREIERHASRDGVGGVYHGVATVRGAMRPGVGFAEVIAGAFPPGSVTGAPKIRAMQIIDELEPFARGAYCGAAGFVSDCGLMRFSVTIRTATIEGEAMSGSRDGVRGALTYPVGAGIVAESNPADEWQETLAKAEAVVRALGESAP